MYDVKALLLTLILSTSLSLYGQQVMVNLEWSSATGNPADLIDYSASTFDDSGNLIVVGNTFTNGESENFLISKFNIEGVLEWEYEYNFNDADSTDFATAVASDQFDNIYITGASFDDMGNFDYATLKLDASGSLQWVSRFNGGSNLDDIPAAIGTDSYGNVYVTGGSKTAANDWDYYTIKYNSSGNEMWAVDYDYNQLTDYASEIHVEPGSGELTVIGGSASSATAWDFAVIHYDSDGNWLGTDREPSGIGTFDKPMAFYQDDDGNIYITGSKSTNGADFDIMTIKLNANLQLKWTQTFDGHQMEDGAYDIITDYEGNVYVAGYSQKTNLGTNALVLKYDSTGSLQWSKEKTPYYPQDSAKATEIALDASGNVYASGYIQDQGDKDVLTMRFDPTGQYGWEKVFENSYDPEEYATHLLVDLFGNVYVTAKSVEMASSSYILLHYSSHQRDIVLMTDSSNNREIAQNELIFRVDPHYLKPDKIDNTDIYFGEVDDFIVSELRNLMADKLGLGSAMGTTPMYKLCPFLTQADTLSVLGNGDTIRNPNYYATFVLSLPLPITEQAGYMTAMDAVDSLLLLSPKIWVAEVRGILPSQIGANDPVYNNSFGAGQQSLHALNPLSLNWPSHINAEPAWDLVYNGSINPKIRVGVIDQGTLWTHEDFTIDQSDTTQNPANSKISGGYNFTNNVSIFSPNSFNNFHGNGVSGIIGALRNNNLGVAGIAGGDMTNNDTGVELFDYIASDTFLGSSIDVGFVIEAITDAIFKDSINVLNMSFGGGSFGFFDSEAIELALRHQITLVASRGNDDSDKKIYPSCYPGVIGVGSTDEYGRRFFYDNRLGGLQTDSSYSISTNYAGSNFGPELDLMAPGVSSMVRTVTGKSIKYAAFWGTSAAAPHVTGVAALLQRFQKAQKSQVLPSLSPEILAPEDVQRILELTAMDIDPNVAGQPQSYAQPGKDQVTGYGLVNAGNALERIKWPDYYIEHVETSNFQSQAIDSLSAFLETMYGSSILNRNFFPKDYFVKVFKVTASIPYSLPTGYHIDIDMATNLPLVWPRNSASDGWKAPYPTRFLSPDPSDPQTFPYFYPTTQLTIDSVTSNAIHISTHFLELAPDPMNPFTFLFWPEEFNSSTRAPKFAVSVLLKNNSLLSVDKLQNKGDLFSLYPNPTDDELHLAFELKKPKEIYLKVYSADGRTQLTHNWGLMTKGEQTKSLSIASLPSGIYFIELIQDDESSFQKLIKY